MKSYFQWQHTSIIRNLKSFIKKTPFEGVARKVHRVLPFPDKNELYDRQTIKVMKRYLRSDSNCIDIGAYSGQILKEMIAVSPQGTHFAFEPLPQFAEFLRAKFPQISVYEVALSDHCGEVEFQHVLNDPGYSGLKQRMYDRPNPIIQTITVQTNRLDNLLLIDIPISLIKIDVEGAEYLALCGGLEIIKRSKPIIIFEAGKESTSYYGVDPEELFELLEEQCQLQVSTMARLLKGEREFSREEFSSYFYRGLDYYFIAYPPEANTVRNTDARTSAR